MMDLPRRTPSLSRRPPGVHDEPAPSGAWAQEEDALIPPISLEPYDWTLDDEADASPQLIPVPPPAWDDSARMRLGRKAAAPEGAILIPVGKAPAEMIPIGKISFAPIPAENLSPAYFVRKIRPRPRPKRVNFSILLLLLSVFALFAFAYLAQAFGR
jgi:hypothetical protein